jgi:GNAT superfamily N-acetyltransferase
VTGAPEEAVRAAAPEDLEGLVALVEAEIAELEASKGGDVWARRESHADPRAAIAAALADPDHLVLAGTLDGVTVGVASVGLASLHDGAVIAVVGDLYVEPEARGIGLGEALMDAMVGWATARGCAGIDAIALPGLRDTKNFFEAHGLVARAIVVHRRL